MNFYRSNSYFFFFLAFEIDYIDRILAFFREYWERWSRVSWRMENIQGGKGFHF